MAIHADQVLGLSSAPARLASVQAIGNGSTSFTWNGYGQPGTYGNTQSRSIAPTNAFTRSRRVGMASFSNGSGGGVNLIMAGAHGMGSEFQAVFVWGIAEPVTLTATRSLVGFTTQTDRIDNQSPLNLLNIVGVGHESGEANLSIYTNDGSGQASRIGLGSAFPANGQSTDPYRLVLSFSATSIGYKLTNLGSGATASGLLTAKLPTNGVALTAQFYRCLTENVGVYPTFDFMHFSTAGDL